MKQKRKVSSESDRLYVIPVTNRFRKKITKIKK